MQGWLDDRVECRHALSELKRLQPQMAWLGLDRSELPWMRVGRLGGKKDVDEKTGRQRISDDDTFEAREARFYDPEIV